MDFWFITIPALSFHLIWGSVTPSRRQKKDPWQRVISNHQLMERRRMQNSLSYKSLFASGDYYFIHKYTSTEIVERGLHLGENQSENLCDTVVCCHINSIEMRLTVTRSDNQVGQIRRRRPRATKTTPKWKLAHRKTVGEVDRRHQKSLDTNASSSLISTKLWYPNLTVGT